MIHDKQDHPIVVPPYEIKGEMLKTHMKNYKSFQCLLTASLASLIVFTSLASADDFNERWQQEQRQRDLERRQDELEQQQRQQKRDQEMRDIERQNEESKRRAEEFQRDAHRRFEESLRWNDQQRRK
jgi:hypothetical protein